MLFIFYYISSGVKTMKEGIPPTAGAPILQLLQMLTFLRTTNGFQLLGPGEKGVPTQPFP